MNVRLHRASRTRLRPHRPSAWWVACWLAATAIASAQSLVLDSFNAGSTTGAVRAGTSWAGQVVAGAGAITVGGTAADDNGWGARGLSLDASGMSFLKIVAQRDAGNAAPALVLQLEDRNLNTQVISVRTTSFAAGVLTAVQVPLTWDANFDPAHITSWTIGGGGLGTVAFRMTLDDLSLSGTTTTGVALAPQITGMAAARVVNAGESVSFSVSASGTAPLSYRWLKDGSRALTDNASASTATLTLANVAPSAAGFYTCTVTNSAGTAVSAPYGLTVTAPVASITLGNLTTSYSGAPRAATATTSPPGLAVAFTYDGNPSAPVNAGRYAVLAAVNDATYGGRASGTLVIEKAAQAIAFAPLPAALVAGTPFSLAATATSGGAVTLALVRGNATLTGTTLTPRDAGEIVVRATQAGDNNHLPATADLVFTTSKQTQSITFAAIADQAAGAASVPLNASASSGLPVSFTIVRGPAAIAEGSLTLTGAGTVVVRASQTGNATFNAAPDVDRVFAVAAPPVPTEPDPSPALPGPSPTEPAPPTPNAAAQLVNVSSRTRAGSGDEVAIAGFVIAGDAPKQVLVRAIGPTLGRFGVAGAIAAPRLEIFHEGTLVASNTGWTRGDAGGIAAAAARAGAFALATDAADSAALVTLAPGSYTAVINATDGRTGVGLLEVYDPSPDTPAPRLSNLSVRAFAGSGADTLIVGFVVRGDTPQRMLLRAIGPTLAQFGVSGALARPQLTVYSGADAIARNTGWPDSPDRGAITEAAARVGAFALPADSRDAVLLLELAPGAYTAQVAGAEGATGVALVEAYDLR